MEAAFVTSVSVPLKGSTASLAQSPVRGNVRPARSSSIRMAIPAGVTSGGVDKFADELKATANAIAAPGKGILAVDESSF